MAPPHASSDRLRTPSPTPEMRSVKLMSYPIRMVRGMTTESVPTSDDAPSHDGPPPDPMLPPGFDSWAPADRRIYLDQRSESTLAGRRITWAYGLVEEAGRGLGRHEDPWDVAAVHAGAILGISRHRASRLVYTAVQLTERLPVTASLLHRGWIGLEAAHGIVEETDLVPDELMPALDREIAARLGPTRRRTHPPQLGPLRKMVTAAVERHDAEGAAARARERREEQDVRAHEAGDDLTYLSALVTADAGLEIMERVERLARTAAAGDPRSIGQLRAAGLLALSRGWTVLPKVDGSHPDGTEGDDPGHGPATPRTVVLHLYAACPGGGVQGAPVETATDTAPMTLAGYGPITTLTRDELLRDARVRIDALADLCPSGREGALAYRPSEALRRFVHARDGGCVFPGCQTAAERCDLDHIVPFDHEHPERGGPTCGDNLACLCRTHHRLKTHGRWSYYRDGDGSYVWLRRGGGTEVRVEPRGVLAEHSMPWAEGVTEFQRGVAELGRPEREGPCRPLDPRTTRRERSAARRRRARR